MIHALAGREDEARTWLGTLDELGSRTYVSPFIPAAIHAYLGQTDRAFELLDQAYAEKTWMMRLLKVAPPMDPLRSDPRFAALLDKVGLPP